MSRLILTLALVYQVFTVTCILILIYIGITCWDRIW